MPTREEIAEARERVFTMESPDDLSREDVDTLIAALDEALDVITAVQGFVPPGEYHERTRDILHRNGRL